MGREVAVVTTWGTPVRGREAKALEIFQDFLTFWAKKAADGKCSEPQAYLAGDGNGGMGIVTCDSDAAHEITETQEYIDLITMGQLVVDDLHVRTFQTGNEVANATQRYVMTLQKFDLA